MPLSFSPVKVLLFNVWLRNQLEGSKTKNYLRVLSLPLLQKLIHLNPSEGFFYCCILLWVSQHMPSFKTSHLTHGLSFVLFHWGLLQYKHNFVTANTVQCRAGTTFKVRLTLMSSLIPDNQTVKQEHEEQANKLAHWCSNLSEFSQCMHLYGFGNGNANVSRYNSSYVKNGRTQKIFRIRSPCFTPPVYSV